MECFLVPGADTVGETLFLQLPRGPDRAGGNPENPESEALTAPTSSITDTSGRDQII